MQLALLLGIPVIGAVAVVDQATKALALRHADTLRDSVEILPFLNLVLVRNPGISFGMLGTVPWWALTGGTLAIVGWLTVLLSRANQIPAIISLGALIGGALSNLIDRLVHGAVTDFIDLHYGGWHWPSFNLADAAICLGAVGMLLWFPGQERKSAAIAAQSKPQAKM